MKQQLLSIIAAAAIALPIAAQNNAPKQLSPSSKLTVAEQLISNFYVEDVNEDSIVGQAIIAMLKTLDPHSAYSTPEETRDLNEPLEGKFSGIGVQFNMSTDTVYVIQTIPGGPSERVGIRPGDRIIQADDSVIAGRKIPQKNILKILRGPKGSKVNLKIKRQNDIIDFLVTRDDIPIHSVDGVYMIQPEVGYIRLTRFAEDSGHEVAQAIDRLKAQGMKRLILDLEDNGGGYLGAAVDIASMLLPHDKVIVYTQGKNSEPTYFRNKYQQPIFDGEVVVMVNQYSASASEILSGALQDHDRGVIVGRRTFGKGLVQRPFPFPDGSMIRLTTARYYTPSGRSIQKHYDKGHGEEYQLDMLNRYDNGELWSADSVKLDKTHPYYTLRNHRTVYGGGGIMPDVFVPVDTTMYSPYYRNLVAKGSIVQTALKYVDNNRDQLLRQYPTEDQFFQNFTVTDDILQQIIDRATADGIEYNDAQFQTSRPVIQAIFRGLLARDIYPDGTYVRSTNPLNPVFNQALNVINDTKQYHKILSGK